MLAELSRACMQVWILAAQFEIRQLSMDAARKVLGRSLGMCPKDRTYKAYIDVSCILTLYVPPGLFHGWLIKHNCPT